MLTISLDEAGVFEDKNNISKNDSSTTLIAGAVYDDKGIEGEKDNEIKRIEAYYRAVFESAQKENPKVTFLFPMDLHYKNKARSRQLVIIKETVRKTLPEFIQLGTFDGTDLLFNGVTLPSRNGFYRIGAIVKSNEGKTSYSNSNQGEFFRDNIASNTYFHMMSEAVEHLVFHNPLDKDHRFCFFIATRQSERFIDDNDKFESYLKQGFEGNKASYLEEDEIQFSILNSDVFRTILMEQYIDNPGNVVAVEELNVQPIRYYKLNDDDYSKQVFLYLADSICSYLTFEIGTDDISEIRKRSQRLSNIKNLIFSYDEADVFFKRAWRDMEVNEYYDALKEMYNISVMNTVASSIYKNDWFKSIKERMYSETEAATAEGKEPHALVEALTELRLSYLTNILNSSEGEFIFRVLENATKRIKDRERFAKIFYYINDIGVVSNCHKGNSTEAAKYFAECEKYAHAVDMEDYIRTRNRYTNALLDSFNYEEALNVVRTTVKIAGGLYELSKSVFGAECKEHFGKTEFAKTLSQAGQCAAFLRNDEAQGFFDDALKLLKGNIANTKITESYKLHYLIDKGSKEEYEKVMSDYNDGAESIVDQLSTIRQNGANENVNISFAFLLYIKGLNKFYTDKEISVVWEDIKSLEMSIDDKRKSTHPWELIYKYLGLLAVKMGENDLARKYCDEIALLIKDDYTIVNTICLFSEAVLLEALGNTNLSKEKYGIIYGILRDNYPSSVPYEPDDIMKHLSTRYTFMYV
ncbi:hypothetical protein [Pseudobutyrivibrio ruminis]|uniref:hypothetical protein n=1 Tax=Pseudobutyrivibrio ruminis TaxID=46206 RepID=UPI00051AB668|nr:hypothetical protein [Pseudobutyrivibrio ruminis]